MTSYRLLLGAALAAILPCGLLSAQDATLPKYAPPEQQPHGEIRSYVNKTLLNLFRLWEVGYSERNISANHVDTVESGAITIGALYTGVGDLGFSGHRAYPMEILGFHRVFGYAPLEIAVARGSFDQAGHGPCNVVFMNKKSPLSQLTLKQLDGIFGNQRSGGWDGMNWTTAAARGPEGNIRTWGQLGLTGEWADKPIHVYGYALTEGSYSHWFEAGVFGGGDAWNPALVESPLAELNKSGPHLGGLHVLELVADDPYAIGYTNMMFYKMNPKLPVKTVALAAAEDGPYAAPTVENFKNRSYPLLETAYIYVNRPPGKALDPTLKDFLSFILSREGQKAVSEDGGYLPLNADELGRERTKLE